MGHRKQGKTRDKRRDRERDREREREKRNRQRKKYGQAKLKHAKRGILSCVLAGTTGGLLALLLGIAYVSAGTAAAYIGGLGLIALLLTMIGIYMGYKGLKERNKEYLTCKIGLACNAIFLLGYITIFLRGLF